MATKRTVLILFLALAITVMGRSDSADATLTKAKEALDASKYADAISLASEVIRADPKKTEAWYVRGEAYSGDHQHELAIKDFTEVLRQDPKHPKALAGRAWIYYCQEAWHKATSDLTLAIQSDRRDSGMYRLRGVSRYETGEYESAIADLKEAVQLEPKLGGNYAILANMYSTCPQAKYRDGGKAVETAKKAYQLEKLHIESVAAALAESGKFDEAVEWQTKAIELYKSVDERLLLKPAEGRLEKYKRKEPLRYRSNRDWAK